VDNNIEAFIKPRKLSEIFKESLQLPSILYHYTSQTGLIEIVQRKEIWATNIFYLNDSLEFEYATGLIREVIDDYMTSCCDELQKLFLKQMNNIASSLTHFYVYVCSLSEEGDQLSQWRGYCPNGNGFSIGFNTSELSGRMVKYSFGLLQCLYDKDKQVEIIKQAIDESMSDLPSNLDKSDADTFKNSINEIAYKVVLRASVYFFPAMARLKHSTFHEEKEWRFVALYSEQQPLPVYFRKGKSMIIPYIRIPLTDNQESINIDRIIIGPTPHHQLAKRAVQVLMDSNKIKCEIELSKTPYRMW